MGKELHSSKQREERYILKLNSEVFLLWILIFLKIYLVITLGCLSGCLRKAVFLL